MELRCQMGVLKTNRTKLFFNRYYTDKDARKLDGITMVAAGYAGDMSEDLCNDLLDDIDFHFNKVRCRKIEQMLPQLNKMVEEEIKGISANV